jgi:hypothetical protein
MERLQVLFPFVGFSLWDRNSVQNKSLLVVVVKITSLRGEKIKASLPRGLELCPATDITQEREQLRPETPGRYAELFCDGRFWFRKRIQTENL